MRNRTVALVFVLVLGALSVPAWSSAQNAVRRMTGEVLAVNRDAEALTVRARVGDRAVDSIFSVEASAAPALAALEPGDTVRVTYVSTHDQLYARNVVKVFDAATPR